MVLAIVDDLRQNGGLHVGQRDLFIRSAVIHHVPGPRMIRMCFSPKKSTT